MLWRSIHIEKAGSARENKKVVAKIKQVVVTRPRWECQTSPSKRLKGGPTTKSLSPGRSHPCDVQREVKNGKFQSILPSDLVNYQNNILDKLSYPLSISNSLFHFIFLFRV